MRLTPTKIRQLILDLPRNGKLTWCLLRDPRVPAARKAALTGALALIVSPVNLPEWIPVVGQMDVLGLTILAAKVFVDSCPVEIVAEHRRAIAEGSSAFDKDLHLSTDRLSRGAGRLVNRWNPKRGSGAGPDPAQVEMVPSIDGDQER